MTSIVHVGPISLVDRRRAEEPAGIKEETNWWRPNSGESLGLISSRRRFGTLSLSLWEAVMERFRHSLCIIVHRWHDKDPYRYSHSRLAEKNWREPFSYVSRIHHTYLPLSSVPMMADS